MRILICTEMVASLASRWKRAVLCAALTVVPGIAAADTVASLLGNFTINQYDEIALDATTVRVRYTVVFGQLPALRELHVADADGDGVTTQQERDDYVARRAPDYASQLALTVDGVALPLHAVRWTTSLPTEQGGFSLRFDVDYEALLPASSDGRVHALRFENRNFAGRLGWREISVKPRSTVSAFDSNGFAGSLTGGLTEALRQLPADGPLDERTVDLRYRVGPMPAGAHPIAPRADAGVVSASPANRPAPSGDDGDWLQRRTKSLVDVISAPTVAPHVAVLALFAAMVLGALHAFSPGHGKTIVGAYLIGSRSTPRHAVFLGATVTVTHTLVVFAIGLATLFASRWFLPERLFPALSLLSGLLVLGMGLVLLMQRWPTARRALGDALIRRLERAIERRDVVDPLPRYRRLPAAAGTMRFGIATASRTPGHRHDHAPLHGHRRPHARRHDHSHEHPHDHSHEHPHEHPHDHSHSHQHGPHDATMHSHGGTMHSHLPPGANDEPVTWRSLLALGVSGGLVPCPSAMVLLLAAIALNKTFYGLVLVVAFSAGLASTLIAVGLVFLSARNRMRGPLGSTFWPRVLPAASAALILVVGVVLCYGALLTFTTRPLGA